MIKILKILLLFVLLPIGCDDDDNPVVPISSECEQGLIENPNYQEAVNEFIYNGNSEKLIETVEIKHAQKIFEDLIQPWQDMSKKFLEDVPESNSKRLLEQVPLSFANELITKDKN